MSESRKKHIGGRGMELDPLNANRVIDGMLAVVATTASTQATGTGASDYNCNLSAGECIVGGKVKRNEAAVADIDLDHASTGSAILTLNYARIYDLVYYKSIANDTIYLRVFKGAIATTAAAAVAVTDAEIDAYLPAGTPYIRVARVTVERTGDTAVTLTYDNSIRNTGVPETIHRPQIY
jgi:hypothetical protein